MSFRSKKAARNGGLFLTFDLFQVILDLRMNVILTTAGRKDPYELPSGRALSNLQRMTHPKPWPEQRKA